MAAKCIVVTGCTSGLGLECVKALLKTLEPGTDIVMACRNVRVAVASADAICAATGASRDRVVVLPEPLDLASLDSVRAFAAALLARKDVGAVATLINNAGIGTNAAVTQSKDGYEAIFATNHLGHFLLTLLLLPSLTACGGRIVNVSSEVHNPASKTGAPDPGQHWYAAGDLAQLATDTGAPGAGAMGSTSVFYSRSKLCNVLFTYELNRRLQSAAAAAATTSGAPAAVTVVAMNPGLMLETGFFMSLGPIIGRVLWLLSPLVRQLAPFARYSPASGSALAQIATAPTLSKSTAVFYDTTYAGAPVVGTSSTLSHEAAHQAGLWAASLKLARVTPAELAAAGV